MPVFTVDDYNNLRKSDDIKQLYVECFNLQVVTCYYAKFYSECSMAEVGVYKGGTAKIMCLNKESCHLWLFDTFEGIPIFDQSKNIGVNEHVGDFKSDLNELKKKLIQFKNIHIIKGKIEDTFSQISEKDKFSLIHLDCDIYEATKFALDKFHDKLCVNGMIILHDYGNPAINASVTSFIREHEGLYKNIPIVDPEICYQLILIKLSDGK